MFIWIFGGAGLVLDLAVYIAMRYIADANQCDKQRRHYQPRG
jgi:hypothetical protein